jgi:outer membrane lipoprotein-sorting protein
MKMHTCLALSLSAAFAIVTPSAPALADAAGDAVLAQVDAAMNKAKTLKFDYEIVNKEGADKSEKSMAMKVQLKGEKRYTEFTSGEMKGTKVLIISPTQMYVYLPAFGKVRRIASHTKDAGMLGMTFSQDDMATTRYSPQYTAAIASEDAGSWHLTLTPKPGQDTPYAKIEVTVTKDKKVLSELKYFSADGKNVKTETRTGYSCEGDVCTPGELKMTDNTKGAFTKLTAKSREVNKEISDDVFTQRNLGE